VPDLSLTHPLILGLGAFLVLGLAFLRWVRRYESRVMTGAGRFDEGRVVGVCGLMGGGKTSFIMSQWVVPALTRGLTVASNFTVLDDGLPGRSIKLRARTFASDVLGIGSSLNVDEETGEVLSGWFIDTACTCGKDHDKDCTRPRGDLPVVACCAGFRARRECRCNAAVVVIDEAHAFVPANNSRPLPLVLHNWLTMARKNHLEIIWATQYYKWVHSGFRRLTEDVFTCQSTMGDGRHEAIHQRMKRGGSDLDPAVVTVVKYDNRGVRGRYDTYEVITPSQTALEMTSAPLGFRPEIGSDL
jgi:hypothetical protein